MANDQPLNVDQKKKLLEIAKKTVHEYVSSGNIPSFEVIDERLNRKEGAFVTIKNNGKLRGCIGNVIGNGPLCHLVRDVAVSATKDARFVNNPISVEELDEIEVEVSVLSEPQSISNVDDIELGVHGVIIQQGSKGGLFLPQVAEETGWSKNEFLSQLCHQKANLSPNCWQNPNTKIYVFTADVFSEHDFK